MPIEPSDNTRVNVTSKPQPIILSKEQAEQIQNQRIQQALARDPDYVLDTSELEKYQNMQNFYNGNYWGYGMFGKQTNYNPSTSQGQMLIQSNYDYSKSNVQNFAENLLTAGAAEGIGQAIKWAVTPVTIGQGAEAIVTSAPLSPTVTKISTIPRFEMHVRNMVPGALKSEYIGTSGGLNTYIQPKIRILSKEQIAKASKTLEKIMTNKGWKKITHPNLEGVGYTKGNWVVSDLGQGNIGKDIFGRVRLTDFSIETVPEFKMAMQRRGGKLINNN